MIKTIEFTIPHRLVRLNEYIRIERGNKYAAAETKRKQTNLCGWYVPNVKINPPVEITMIWTVRYLGCDPDNISMGAKFILDAMVHKGLLPNDNLTNIKSLKHEFVRGEEEQVKVIVKRWKNV